MKLTLKQIRLINEITQQEMASLLEIHVQTYRKIEVNPSLATVEQAVKISNYLKVDYNEIFFNDNSSFNRDTA